MTVPCYFVDIVVAVRPTISLVQLLEMFHYQFFEFSPGVFIKESFRKDHIASTWRVKQDHPSVLLPLAKMIPWYVHVAKIRFGMETYIVDSASPLVLEKWVLFEPFSYLPREKGEEVYKQIDRNA